MWLSVITSQAEAEVGILERDGKRYLAKQRAIGAAQVFFLAVIHSY